MLIKESLIPGIRPPAGKDTDYLYIDIETTGLSRDRTILYLLGCGYYEGKTFKIIQWFNNDAVSEVDILSRFSDFLNEGHWTVVTFNGDSFDLPYLRHHLDLSGLSASVPDLFTVDLYRILRPFRKLFGLPGGRQKDWERFVGLGREDRKEGGQLIFVYKEYLKSKNESLLDMLFLHNYEDILHLARLRPLMTLGRLSEGHFQYLNYDFDQRVFKAGQASIRFYCILDEMSEGIPEELLKVIDIDSPVGAARIENKQLSLFIPALSSSMKHYFPDYRKYYYLPDEDRAVHKSIGRYVEKEYRRVCTVENCYMKKEGVFLPLYNKKHQEHFTLYRKDFESKCFYLDLEELVRLDNSTLHNYLHDFLKHLLSDAASKAVIERMK